MSTASNGRTSFLHGNLPARTAQILVDVAICVISLVSAYLIRFEWDIPGPEIRQMILVAPYLALARLTTNASYGVYRVVWRYVGVRETVLFIQTIATVSAVLLALRLFWPTNIQYLKIPISIIVLEGTFTFVGLTGSRFLRRILHERSRRGAPVELARVPTLLIGAGEAGLAIAKEALRHPDLGINVVGYLDDDQAKAGMEIHGLRVLGTTADLAAAVERTKATQAIITTTTIPSRAILALIEACRPLAINVRIVPALFEILGSGLKAHMLREVRIEDLLSREPVPPSLDIEDLTKVYRGKRILVTGAGGSIGSELCRQLALMQPGQLLLLERDETNLFEIERELRDRAGDGEPPVPVLLDITDGKGLDKVFRDYRPEIVFHAAAFKHVPMMERFPALAIHNNVFGTRELAELARRHGVELFVMISTDKAVNPTSVMGATKRFAELVVQRLAQSSKTRYSCVRFGNVLGSRGSVVGIFREQIERGGPVTVTHPDVTRYFMTIQEAVNLVLQAATLGDQGEVFLLDMGEPVKIIDLARQMIRLSGASEEQIPIAVVGMRPGEKLYEELRTDLERNEPTALRKISRCQPCALDEAQLDAILERLDFLVRARDNAGIRRALKDLEIGFATGPMPAAER